MVSTINRNKSSNNHLSGRVIRSGVWVFALRITERLLYFFRLIILARILAPSDFGLFGIALLTMMTLENFSQTGFESALIQKKEAVNQYLDTAWTVGVIRSIFLFLAMFFFGPYVAAFFETTQATPIIRVLAFSFLIKSFRNIGVVFFNKDLEFKKQ
ncbi:MAG: lipopolysaccharide biosynthesis protein, partial [Deltaproteobacteria bacterium]